MSTSFRLLLPTHLYIEMLAQAKAELPNECCGILAGTLDGEAGIGRVVKRYALVNAAASPREYLSDDKSTLAAFNDCRRLDLRELAIYHSHPTSAPVPSRKDIEMNYYPEVMSLIIGLQGDEPIVRGWWLSADDYREAEWQFG